MIILINPNSTESMTRAMLDTARATAPGLTIEGWTSTDGPPAIQGAEDGVAASGPLLKLVSQAAAQGAGCIIIGCFDDTALDEARGLATCPVIGIGQAAYHLAAMAGARFSVVTTLDVSVPILEENIKTYGLSHAVGRVCASGVPVLALEENPDAAAQSIEAAITDLLAEDSSQAIVLGCGGMVDVQRRLKHVPNLRLIDGVRAATHIAAALTTT